VSTCEPVRVVQPDAGKYRRAGLGAAVENRGGARCGNAIFPGKAVFHGVIEVAILGRIVAGTFMILGIRGPMGGE